MKIAELIRTKGSAVVTIAPGESVSALLALLAKHRIGAAVVSVDGSTLIGIASERDVVRHLHASGAGILEQPVSSIMSVDVVTCSPHDELETVAEMMTERRFRHMPIVSGGHLEAIITIGDVVKAHIDHLKDERDHLVGYIQQ